MNIKKWISQIVTGPDNQTIAIGRSLGLIIFIIFLVVVPVVTLIGVAKGLAPAAEWNQIVGGLQVYVPSIALSIAGLVGLTGHTEPPSQGQ